MKLFLIAIEGRLHLREGTSPLDALRRQTSHWVPKDFDGRTAVIYEMPAAAARICVDEVKP